MLLSDAICVPRHRGSSGTGNEADWFTSYILLASMNLWKKGRYCDVIERLLSRSMCILHRGSGKMQLFRGSKHQEMVFGHHVARYACKFGRGRRVFCPRPAGWFAIDPPAA